MWVISVSFMLTGHMFILLELILLLSMWCSNRFFLCLAMMVIILSSVQSAPIVCRPTTTWPNTSDHTIPRRHLFLRRPTAALFATKSSARKVHSIDTCSFTPVCISFVKSYFLTTYVCHLTFFTVSWAFNRVLFELMNFSRFVVCRIVHCLRQEKPTNCGTKVADVLKIFLAGKL